MVSIRLSSLVARRDGSASPTSKESINFQRREEVQSFSGNRASFIVGVRWAFPEDHPPAKAPLIIQVERLLTYDGVPGDATAEELLAFARTNAVFNAWPFLRADVHDAALKLGLDPIVLEMFRIGPPSH